jgi:hypothetical protein
MSKQRKPRNPEVHYELQRHADTLGLELVSYKHVTVDRLPVAFHVLHEMDRQLGNRERLAMSYQHDPTGLEIVVRRP